MNNGWIKLHRQMRDNPFMKKPAYRAIWIELLLEAAHDGKSILWKGKRISIKEGQLTCGAKQLSVWTGVPRGTVERVLKCFKDEDMIEVQTSNLFSLVTIKKWSSYQNNKDQNEEQMRNKRGTSEEQMRTPKECKNERMKEIQSSSIEEEISDHSLLKKEKVDKRNPDVETVLFLIQKITGKPPKAGSMTRIHAANFAKQMRKFYPNFDLSILVERVLTAAMEGDSVWHRTKCYDPKHLYDSWQEIVALAQEKQKKTSAQSAGANAF